MRFATKTMVALVMVPACFTPPAIVFSVPAIAASSPLSSVEQP